MKIALISDIHANLAALEAVLPYLGAYDAVLCAGDFVGYYRQPNEVCQIARDRKFICVRGNHDAYVLGTLTPSEHRKDAYRTEWTARALTQDNMEWLQSLPIEVEARFDGVSIQLRHASPWDEESYLYPDYGEFSQISLDKADLLVLGHTHHPMQKQLKDGLLVNPGSVGQPRDWNPKASFASFDTQTRRVEFHRIAYDVQAVQDDLKQSGWPDSSITILSRQRG